MKPDDIVEARKLRLACLMARDVLDRKVTDREGLFSAREAELAREACKIADAVIETYISKPER